ncbi:hypothetical protein GF339_01705 [candidate division KSB3 bacterium]|uniref:Uncharacterized protein n=1 Tax=candidate division KSB3 bacterium TaxID=2044937 RepID=A0A9D5Q4U0_9BACT|nr:hypothetical protein [candidate division KSB3 bacterium]MBD3323266.1 hypothetical protein [candidate division KSB3 bacterium]
MDLLTQDDVRTLATPSDEEHISLFFPTYRAGKQIQQNPIRFKNLLDNVEEPLRARGFRKHDLEELLEPAVQLVDDLTFWQHQSDGFALFLSPTLFRYYRLPLQFEEVVVVGDRFHIKPLLPLLSGDGRFYLLALSQNAVRVFQGTRQSISELEVEAIPQSLADALKYEEPLKQIQYHSGAQVPGGKAKGSVIFHGQGVGSDDKTKKKKLKEFFQQIDAGMQDLLQQETAPLVLAGVEYLFPLYQEANTYAHLVKKGIPGNPEDLSAQELHQEAWQIVEPLFLESQQQQYQKYQELLGTGSPLASHDLREIVPAAQYGRIETLFVAAKTYQWGRFTPETKEVVLHPTMESDSQDLLDLAAVQTLLHGGTVYAMQTDTISSDNDGALAAIFRY